VRLAEPDEPRKGLDLVVLELPKQVLWLCDVLWEVEIESVFERPFVRIAHVREADALAELVHVGVGLVEEQLDSLVRA
jgi:hypothetical protein